MSHRYVLTEHNPSSRGLWLTVVSLAAVWLDRADQIESLLQAAADLDRNARHDAKHIPRHAMISVLP